MTDHKAAAVACWTAEPCGTRVARGEPGTRAYMETLVEGRHQYAPWMLEQLDYAATRGLAVLDVGCGQGIDLVRYGLAGARPTGVDLTPRHVELANAHLAAMELDGEAVQGDAERLPFADASFDRASSNGVLHHTPDMDTALREILRVLRPGGEARIIVYNKASLHYWLSQVLGHGIIQGRLFRERSMSRVMSRHEGGSHENARPLVRVYTRGQLAAMLERAGFTAVETTLRHFRFDDTPLTKPLRQWERGNRSQVNAALGRWAGWYIIARGSRPNDA